MRTYTAGLVMVVALAGCSMGSKGASSSSTTSRNLPKHAEDVAGGGGTADGAPAAVTRTAVLARMVVRTGALTVTVPDVPAAARTVVASAERVGGFLEAEESTLAAGTTLTLRVPPERFTATLDAVSRLGTVAERRVSTEDVTTDVADVDGRLAAAKASTARLRGFLDHADSVTEVTALESELSSREADLESLQSRRRSLGEQTAFATVTATLRAGAPAPPAKHAAGGFTGGLRHGWAAFTGAVSVLLVVLGAVAPFAAVVAVVAVPVLALRRRRRAAAAA